MSTWVLLRGLMRESRHWGDFQFLFQNAVSAPVVTLDLPGNGRLHMQTSANSVEGMVNHVRTQLTQLGYEPPYRILALSLGAMVAVAWCESLPVEIEIMVLINTSLPPYNHFYHRLRPENYLALSLLLFGTDSQREKLILKLTSTRSRDENLNATLEQWTTYSREFPVSPGNILRQLQAAISFNSVTGTPKTPVLLLASQKDQLVNVKCSIQLAHQWGCALRLHPIAGHDLPLDDGLWVIQQIMEWLNSSLTSPELK